MEEFPLVSEEIKKQKVAEAAAKMAEALEKIKEFNPILDVDEEGVNFASMKYRFTLPDYVQPATMGICYGTGATEAEAAYNALHYLKSCMKKSK
ncbi:MAG TPA: hypothetical protein VJC14_01445 [Candidatus Paceibacterota bacterium]